MSTAAEQAKETARIVQTHFKASDYWEFEKSLGHGSYGLAVLLRRKGALSMLGRRRRVAVKVALPRGVQAMRIELRNLKVRLGVVFFPSLPFLGGIFKLGVCAFFFVFFY